MKGGGDMKMVSSLILMVLLAISTLGTEKKKMTCTLTGKEVKACCCEELKSGKMFCTLAKKEIDKCCCTGM